jgi:hypothetical protein
MYIDTQLDEAVDQLCLHIDRLSELLTLIAMSIPMTDAQRAALEQIRRDIQASALVLRTHGDPS